jgi:hypothetical protein
MEELYEADPDLFSPSAHPSVMDVDDREGAAAVLASLAANAAGAVSGHGPGGGLKRLSRTLKGSGEGQGALGRTRSARHPAGSPSAAEGTVAVAVGDRGEAAGVGAAERASAVVDASGKPLRMGGNVRRLFRDAGGGLARRSAPLFAGAAASPRRAAATSISGNPSSLPGPGGSRPGSGGQPPAATPAADGSSADAAAPRSARDGHAQGPPAHEAAADAVQGAASGTGGVGGVRRAISRHVSLTLLRNSPRAPVLQASATATQPGPGLGPVEAGGRHSPPLPRPPLPPSGGALPSTPDAAAGAGPAGQRRKPPLGGTSERRRDFISMGAPPHRTSLPNTLAAALAAVREGLQAPVPWAPVDEPSSHAPRRPTREVGQRRCPSKGQRLHA